MRKMRKDIGIDFTLAEEVVPVVEYSPISHIPYWEAIDIILEEVDSQFNICYQGRGQCGEWLEEMLKRLRECLWVQEVKLMRTFNDKHSWIAVKINDVWYVLDRTVGQYKEFRDYPSGIYGTLERADRITSFYNDRNSFEIKFSADLSEEDFSDPDYR